jgi:hypothetical protein
MPYDWQTGTVIPSFAGLPSTYRPPAGALAVGSRPYVPLGPAAGGGIDYHTFVPAKGGWKLPTGTHLGFTKGKGYYAAPGAAAAAAKTGTAAGGMPTIDSIIKQIYGTIETPAQQEARINREINAQISAQQKMIEDMYARQRADALATMQAQSLAGQAAAAMNKDLFASVGGEFNAAASEMKGLSHGLSKNAAGATAGDVKAANAGLASLGNAPVAEGGTFGVGGETQRGVEDYRGGTLAAQMFGTQGEAANFGLAGMIGSQALRATQEAEAELHSTLQDLRGKESDAINALASGRIDLYHQYKQDAADARVKSLTLVQGLIAQKQANAQASAKLAAQYARDVAAMRDKDRKYGLAVTAENRKAATAKVNAKATAIRLDQGQQRIDNAAAANAARIAISQGNLTIAQQKELRAALKDAIAAGQVDVNGSRAKGFVIGRDGKPILDAAGKKIPSSMLSSASKQLTPGQQQRLAEKANQLASDMFYGYGNQGGKRVPITKTGKFNPDDASTYGTGRMQYTAALRALLRNKIPEAEARQALDALYDRGDQGRPFFSQYEKQVIQAAYNKQYGKVKGPQHYKGLLNTLNTQLRNEQYGDFDRLIQQILHAVGL